MDRYLAKDHNGTRSDFFAACAENDFISLARLIVAGAPLVIERDSRGLTPLHICATVGATVGAAVSATVGASVGAGVGASVGASDMRDIIPLIIEIVDL